MVMAYIVTAYILMVYIVMALLIAGFVSCRMGNTSTLSSSTLAEQLRRRDIVYIGTPLAEQLRRCDVLIEYADMQHGRWVTQIEGKLLVPHLSNDTFQPTTHFK